MKDLKRKKRQQQGAGGEKRNDGRLKTKASSGPGGNLKHKQMKQKNSTSGSSSDGKKGKGAARGARGSYAPREPRLSTTPILPASYWEDVLVKSRERSATLEATAEIRRRKRLPKASLDGRGEMAKIRIENVGVWTFPIQPDPKHHYGGQGTAKESSWLSFADQGWVQEYERLFLEHVDFGSRSNAFRKAVKKARDKDMLWRVQLREKHAKLKEQEQAPASGDDLMETEERESEETRVAVEGGEAEQSSTPGGETKKTKKTTKKKRSEDEAEQGDEDARPKAKLAAAATLDATAPAQGPASTSTSTATSSSSSFAATATTAAKQAAQVPSTTTPKTSKMSYPKGPSAETLQLQSLQQRIMENYKKNRAASIKGEKKPEVLTLAVMQRQMLPSMVGMSKSTEFVPSAPKMSKKAIKKNLDRFD